MPAASRSGTSAPSTALFPFARPARGGKRSAPRLGAQCLTGRCGVLPWRNAPGSTVRAPRSTTPTVPPLGNTGVTAKKVVSRQQAVSLVFTLVEGADLGAANWAAEGAARWLHRNARCVPGARGRLEAPRSGHTESARNRPPGPHRCAPGRVPRCGPSLSTRRPPNRPREERSRWRCSGARCARSAPGPWRLDPVAGYISRRATAANMAASRGRDRCCAIGTS
jgi:hypothetical protein